MPVNQQHAPHVTAEMEYNTMMAAQDLTDARKMHDDMMKRLEQEKQDLERQINDFQKTESELEKFKEMENLRKLQLKLWQERKSLFSLNEKKRSELDNMKKSYFNELAKTKAEIDHYNNLKLAQKQNIESEKAKIGELREQIKDLKNFRVNVKNGSTPFSDQMRLINNASNYHS